MFRTYRTLGLTTVSLCAYLLCQGGALATDYVFSSAIEQNHILTQRAHLPFVEAVKSRTNGEVSFKYYGGASLLPAKGMLQGIVEGVTQGGFLSVGYYPSEMPLWNVVGDLGFTNPDELVIGFAATEFAMTDQDGRSDWSRNKLVVTGVSSTPSYHFMCRSELISRDDFAGKRIRTPGAAWSRFVESIGAVPVSIAATEVYTALERGTIDCTTLDSTHLLSGATLRDIVRSVNMLNMGPFFTQGVFVFNQDFWNGLPREQKDLIFEESAKGIVRATLALSAGVDENLKFAKESGRISVVEPSADLQAAFDKFVADGIGGVMDIAKKNNVPNAERATESFKKLITKWQGLLANVDRKDEAALVALFTKEVYAKIDPATYGAN